MNIYEGMFLLDPADAAGNWENLKQHVTELLEGLGCEILYSERWPDRKLAYEIKGCRKGAYFLTFFRANGDVIPRLRQEAKISERILRFLLLRKDNALEEIEKLKVERREDTAVADDKDKDKEEALLDFESEEERILEDAHDDFNENREGRGFEELKQDSGHEEISSLYEGGLEEENKDLTEDGS